MQVTTTASRRLDAAARRTQIIDAAIEVVARHGVTVASYERIRAEAGISSTRLISYHFASKEALMRAIVEHVVAAAAESMTPAIAAATSSRQKLASYIRSNLDFAARHPSRLRCVIEILTHVELEESEPTAAGSAELLLRQLFDDGQRHGEMRTFDPTVMAATVRAAIDRAVVTFSGEAASREPSSMGEYAEELVELFDRAIRIEETA